MEHEGSLLHSQALATCPILSQLNPVYISIPLLECPLFSNLRLGLASGLFPLGMWERL